MHIDFDQFQASLDDIGEEQTAINEYKLLRARDVLIVAQRNLRNLAIELDALLINYMRANACDIAISDTERLYVGTTKVTKSYDDQGILMAIMEAGNGNLELLTTGDGGMTPEERGHSQTLVYQYLPSRYGMNPDDLRKADAIEVVIGQGAKPGGGGMLLGQKITERVAGMRCLPPGVDQRSACRHPDWTGPDDLAIKLDPARGGRIGDGVGAHGPLPRRRLGRRNGIDQVTRLRRGVERAAQTTPTRRRTRRP